MKKLLFAVMGCFALSSLPIQANEVTDLQPEASIMIKVPGNSAHEYLLNYRSISPNTYCLEAEKQLPMIITQRYVNGENGSLQLEMTLEATEKTYFHFNQRIKTNATYDHSQFYLPGFWYRRNERSPKEAPSFHTSQSWTVREDRLSAPLCGVFDAKKNMFTTVIRRPDVGDDALTASLSGEVILSGSTTLGYVGFANEKDGAFLSFGFPYQESPRSYVRKLTLAPSITAFQEMDKGEKLILRWDIKQGKASDFSEFVKDVWEYSYDLLSPSSMDMPYSTQEMKSEISNYFMNSYVDKYPLKFYSGVHIVIDDCKSFDIAEVGFVGRTLLNAYNALEYAEQVGRDDLKLQAENIISSYIEHGFTSNGFFREVVNFADGRDIQELSIRRQSEGVYAMLFYMQYRKAQGKKELKWEKQMRIVLDNFLKLQNADGSFPRKFNDALVVSDASGGSTPSATVPLVMAYAYFKDKRYLDAAKRTVNYLEKEIISKADYFSSTLDANCEDKEASLYAATATYYLAQVTTGKERQRYADLCLKSAYFALSWYYLWDVPFAKGQMLGDIGLKSRGWGNVSVENNHIDVFIFEFASILNWLAEEYKEKRFVDFSSVINASMRQLLPREGFLCGIAKPGYYPEVVQHTQWDYGHFGKGFYNLHFAPGWVISSLWQLLSPERVQSYFIQTKVLNKK